MCGQISEHIERLVNLLKRDEPPGLQEPEEEDAVESIHTDDEIEEV